MSKLPIGVDNFHKLVSGGYLFCDKTAMITEFLGKGDEVTLIARPRRWGKTLNMSMLQHFFAPEVNGISTAGLFDDLAIGKLEEGKYIKQHQGKHPVIMISFKDVNSDNFQGAYNAVYELISTLYESYTYLFNSDKVNAIQLKKLYRIVNNEANQAQLVSSLKLLSQCLYQHHGHKVYILIDEYDTPLNKAYGNSGYLDTMVAFMRNLFSSCLKGNTTLERGVLTGILRVSKDSMLSGLNNLKTYTILDQGYSKHFGFSEQEVQDLFAAQDLSMALDQVKDWYNGYKVGNIVLYNPWSILYCLSEEGSFDVYWVNTGNNDLVKEVLFRSSPGIKRKFEQLMQGEALSVAIDKHLSFELLEKDETALWSLLLFVGYLKLEKSSLSLDSDLYDCDVSIPNQEVCRLYNRFFKEWLSSQFPEDAQYHSFLSHLVVGNVPLFMRYLTSYLLQSASCFDTKVSKKSEGFYHGFVLAMIASLSTTHHVRSNRESGFGRYDILLIPKNGTKSILLEFKHVRKEDELENSARSALEQIQEQAYRTELLAYPDVKEVVEVGISFSGKAAIAAYTVYDLVGKHADEVMLTSRYEEDYIY